MEPSSARPEPLRPLPGRALATRVLAPAGDVDDPARALRRDFDAAWDEGYRQFVVDLGGHPGAGEAEVVVVLDLAGRIRSGGGRLALVRLPGRAGRAFGEAGLAAHLEVFADRDAAVRALAVDLPPSWPGRSRLDRASVCL